MMEAVKLSDFVEENQAELTGKPWKDVLEFCQDGAEMPEVTVANIKTAFKYKEIPFPGQIKKKTISPEDALAEAVSTLARGIALLHRKLDEDVPMDLLALAGITEAELPFWVAEKVS